jgi:hypothetical protein
MATALATPRTLHTTDMMITVVWDNPDLVVVGDDVLGTGWGVGVTFESFVVFVEFIVLLSVELLIVPFVVFVSFVLFVVLVSLVLLGTGGIGGAGISSYTNSYK